MIDDFFKNYEKFKDDQNVKFNKTFHRFLTMVKDNFYSYFVLNSFDNKNKSELFEEYDEQMLYLILNQVNIVNLSNFIDYYNKN